MNILVVSVIYIMIYYGWYLMVTSHGIPDSLVIAEMVFIPDDYSEGNQAYT